MDLKCVATITEARGNSTTGAFKGAKVGDKIYFTCPMTRAGYRHGGNGLHGTTYAKYIHIENVRTGGVSDLTFNQIEKTLKNFEFEEIQ